MNQHDHGTTMDTNVISTEIHGLRAYYELDPQNRIIHFIADHVKVDSPKTKASIHYYYGPLPPANLSMNTR
jgi:hypothetical protein